MGRQVASLSEMTTPGAVRPPNRQRKSGVPANPPPVTVTTDPPEARTVCGVTRLTKGSTKSRACCTEQRPARTGAQGHQPAPLKRSGTPRVGRRVGRAGGRGAGGGFILPRVSTPKAAAATKPNRN